MRVKWLFTFKHFKFPLLPLLTHSAMCSLGGGGSQCLGLNCTETSGFLPGILWNFLGAKDEEDEGVVLEAKLNKSKMV